MKNIKVRKLSARAMKPYGKIIDKSFVKDDGYGDKFGVLLKEASRGWRIGYLVLRKKAIVRLEKHPDSLETFEPITGKAVIALASNKTPDKMELFFLDKPVVVKKGVWHDLFALSGECEIKIFENIRVKVDYHYLKNIILA